MSNEKKEGIDKAVEDFLVTGFNMMTKAMKEMGGFLERLIK